MKDGAEAQLNLSDLLEINVETLSEPVLATWRPEINNPALRSAILANPFMAEHIIKELRSKYMIPDDLTIDHCEEGRLIRTLLSADSDVLYIQLGCAWNANAIAYDVLRGKLRFDDVGLTRDLVKASMVYRDNADKEPTTIPVTRKKLLQDGQDTLLSWLGTLPREISNLVSLRLPLNHAKLCPSQADKRACLCAAVLRDLEVSAAE